MLAFILASETAHFWGKGILSPLLDQRITARLRKTTETNRRVNELNKFVIILSLESVQIP
jgi:hypothetical protein